MLQAYCLIKKEFFSGISSSRFFQGFKQFLVAFTKFDKTLLILWWLLLLIMKVVDNYKNQTLLLTAVLRQINEIAVNPYIFYIFLLASHFSSYFLAQKISHTYISYLQCSRKFKSRNFLLQARPKDVLFYCVSVCTILYSLLF